MIAQPVIDLASLLRHLKETLSYLPDTNERYFNRIGENHLFNPLQEEIQGHATATRNPIPAEFFSELGIRNVTLNGAHDRFMMPAGYSHSARDPNQLRWHVFRNSAFIEDLKAVLKDCPVIVFTDWVTIDGASQLWDGFLHDVIKPLDNPAIDFIFYLGDPSGKPSHEVDEAIDIISDFSTHGNVTLLLHEREAEALWSILNGKNLSDVADPSLSLIRYRSLYSAMSVDRLLIYTVEQATLFSTSAHFELRAKMTQSPHQISQQDKDHFNAGYSLGLLLGLDIEYATALGLATYGTFLNSGEGPTKHALQNYLADWIDGLA